jgi:hypothetical protein
MEVKYVEKGEKGKQCIDCKNFMEEKKSSGIGKCFGYAVKARGSCKLFDPKP